MKNVFLSILMIFFMIPQGISNEKNPVNLEIRVMGIRNDDGHLSIAVFRGREGFPEETQKAYTLMITEINKGVATFRIPSLSPGEYAFAILHDEDMDGEMDKNLLGIPKEGFAFSRNFKPTVGAPDFDEVAIRVNDHDVDVEVEMIYYL